MCKFFQVINLGIHFDQYEYIELNRYLKITLLSYWI